MRIRKRSRHTGIEGIILLREEQSRRREQEWLMARKRAVAASGCARVDGGAGAQQGEVEYAASTLQGGLLQDIVVSQGHFFRVNLG